MLALLRRQGTAVLAFAGVLAAGAIARVWHWREVLTDAGVRLAFDSDPNYHVLQAERFLRGGLDALWFDPNLNWPHGAVVPWPPLFDLLIAGAARVAFGADATREEVAFAAAWVPVAGGLATLLVVAGLGRALLGKRGGLGAALVVALLMGHVMASAVGRADQHVVEVLLWSGLLLAFAMSGSASTAPRRLVARLVFGLLVALAFWNWMGSALNLVLPVAFAGAAWVLLEDEHDGAASVARTLAVGLGAGAGFLAATVWVFGPDGALGTGTLLGLSGLHVCVIACGAAFGALLLLARQARRRATTPARRILEVAAAAVLPVAGALLPFPGIREGVRSGLTALGAANPWYSSIMEFQHLLFSCHYPLIVDAHVALMYFGLTVPAALLAIPSLVARWRAGERRAVLFLAAWAVLYVVLTLARRRFGLYGAIPLALLAWEGVRFGATSLVNRFRLPGAARPVFAALGLVAVIAPSARDIPDVFLTQPPPGTAAALAWLRAQPASQGREGVLSNWDLGHLVLYYADKPVLSSPFGTEGGPGALQDAAQFAFGADPDGAEMLLRRRRIGFIALQDPRMDSYVDGALVAPGNRVVMRTCSYEQGISFSFASSYGDLMAPRLFLFDGLSAPDRPALPLPWARLVYETGASPATKIFGVVPGAVIRITGAPPDAPVSATVTLQTNEGRPLGWQTVETSDGNGIALLRVPYATGMNGAVFATAWTIEDGTSTIRVAVPEEAVIGGGTVDAEFPPTAAGRAASRPGAR